MYTPKHLKRWTKPDCYAGASWPEYYSSGVGRSRDSDCLEESNFQVMLRELGGESDTVLVIRESHWAVGWVEWIAIHETDEKALRTADEQVAGLEDYPVLDENHWSELEYEWLSEAWTQLSVRERAELCKESGDSIFAARRDYLPSDDQGYIRDRLVY